MALRAPVEVSHAKQQEAQRLGNVTISRRVSRACGYAAPELMVICLDADNRMDERSQLAMLARARRGATLRAGSPAAGRAVAKVLAAAGAEYADIPVHVRSFEACEGACNSRVEIRGAFSSAATSGVLR